MCIFRIGGFERFIILNLQMVKKSLSPNGLIDHKIFQMTTKLLIYMFNIDFYPIFFKLAPILLVIKVPNPIIFSSVLLLNGYSNLFD